MHWWLQYILEIDVRIKTQAKPQMKVFYQFKTKFKWDAYFSSVQNKTKLEPREKKQSYDKLSPAYLIYKMATKIPTLLHMDTSVLVNQQIHSSALCGHWVPSRAIANRDGWWKSQRNPRCWHALMPNCSSYPGIISRLCCFSLILPNSPNLNLIEINKPNHWGDNFWNAYKY